MVYKQQRLRQSEYHCLNLSWTWMNGPKASSLLGKGRKALASTEDGHTTLLGAAARSLYLPVHELCMIDAQGSYVEVILSRVLAKFHRTTAENENICFQKCDFLVNTADGYCCVWLWNLDKADVECGVWGFPCRASEHWVLLHFRFVGPLESDQMSHAAG